MTAAARGSGWARSARSAVVVALGLTLAGCTGTTPLPEPTTASATPTPSTAIPAQEPEAIFTFGAAADPTGLDPALVVDTESYRITRQILEGLVSVDPLTSEPVPLLASSWEERDEGRAYAFTLREDVEFHDGEPFNAEAVCANFDRWYSLPPAARTVEGIIAFGSVFNAYSDAPELSIYSSCQPLGEFEVLIQLSSRLTGFIPTLAMPSFAMSSPRALEEFAADNLSEERNDTELSQYALNPVGTGPFTFESWAPGEVRLSSFDDYWGERGEIGTVVFVTLPLPDERLEALNTGQIDGYDFVTVDNAGELVREGQQLLQRDPYSILYLGMNQDFPGVDSLLFRQAIAHAIDKQAVIDGLFLNGTAPADQFVPPKLAVTNEEITTYDYDVELARSLLEESGYDGEPLPFHYPTDVSRPYLPAPEGVFAVLQTQLEEAGFTIEPVPTAWADGYLEALQNDDDRAFHLLGWSGTYQDPDNFVGQLFGATTTEFAFNDNQLFSKMNRARTLPNGEDRTAAYQDISDQLARRLPAVPLAFPISALAVSERVAAYPVSPLMNEVFNLIDLTDVDLEPASDD
ncbi:ABC transporter substrate-binding protein [Arthrobacter sp. H20]|uniref:ABC transporter substrate-binding protein n=1 Tax=Arthrobacter sp. H20 TaxID=1267981 RepID=UPI0009DDA141|nr:ABC transporter substrate-binding protein [Arthrobacter sp. H20]